MKKGNKIWLDDARQEPDGINLLKWLEAQKCSYPIRIHTIALKLVINSVYGLTAAH